MTIVGSFLSRKANRVFVSQRQFVFVSQSAVRNCVPKIGLPVLKDIVHLCFTKVGLSFIEKISSSFFSQRSVSRLEKNLVCLCVTKVISSFVSEMSVYLCLANIMSLSCNGQSLLSFTYMSGSSFLAKVSLSLSYKCQFFFCLTKVGSSLYNNYHFVFILQRLVPQTFYIELWQSHFVLQGSVCLCLTNNISSLSHEGQFFCCLTKVIFSFF